MLLLIPAVILSLLILVCFIVTACTRKRQVNHINLDIVKLEVPHEISSPAQPDHFVVEDIVNRDLESPYKVIVRTEEKTNLHKSSLPNIGMQKAVIGEIFDLPMLSPVAEQNSHRAFILPPPERLDELQQIEKDLRESSNYMSYS